MFTKEQATKAQRGSRGRALLFLWSRLDVSATPWPFYPWERDPLPFTREAGWAEGQVWKVVENLTPTRIWSLDCPAHSESLHRVR
jgi:hypothetical protein